MPKTLTKTSNTPKPASPFTNAMQAVSGAYSAGKGLVTRFHQRWNEGSLTEFAGQALGYLQEHVDPATAAYLGLYNWMSTPMWLLATAALTYHQGHLKDYRDVQAYGPFLQQVFQNMTRHAAANRIGAVGASFVPHIFGSTVANATSNTLRMLLGSQLNTHMDPQAKTFMQSMPMMFGNWMFPSIARPITLATIAGGLGVVQYMTGDAQFSIKDQWLKPALNKAKALGLPDPVAKQAEKMMDPPVSATHAAGSAKSTAQHQQPFNPVKTRLGQSDHHSNVIVEEVFDDDESDDDADATTSGTPTPSTKPKVKKVTLPLLTQRKQAIDHNQAWLTALLQDESMLHQPLQRLFGQATHVEAGQASSGKITLAKGFSSRTAELEGEQKCYSTTFDDVGLLAKTKHGLPFAQLRLRQPETPLSPDEQKLRCHFGCLENLAMLISIKNANGQTGLEQLLAPEKPGQAPVTLVFEQDNVLTCKLMYHFMMTVALQELDSSQQQADLQIKLRDRIIFRNSQGEFHNQQALDAIGAPLEPNEAQLLEHFTQAIRPTFQSDLDGLLDQSGLSASEHASNLYDMFMRPSTTKKKSKPTAQSKPHASDADDSDADDSDAYDSDAYDSDSDDGAGIGPEIDLDAEPDATAWGASPKSVMQNLFRMFSQMTGASDPKAANGTDTSSANSPHRTHWPK